MFGILAKLAAILRCPGGWRFLLSPKPRSLTSFYIAKELVKHCGTLKTIFDCGANVGQFTRACSVFFPDAKIFAVEPSESAVSALKVNLADNKKLEVRVCVLGATDGETLFFPASDSQCSSVLPINQSVTFMQGIQQEHPITATMRSLDSLFADSRVEAPALLKLDLQGYELEALKGATKMLAKCDFVMLEAGFNGNYVDEPSLEELWCFLAANNYELFKPLNFLRDATGSIVQMDALFRRTQRTT